MVLADSFDFAYVCKDSYIADSVFMQTHISTDSPYPNLHLRDCTPNDKYHSRYRAGITFFYTHILGFSYTSLTLSQALCVY